ncbi:MAG: inositol monophosphatase family protein [Rubrivivax sp.]
MGPAPPAAALEAWRGFAEDLADEARALFAPHLAALPGVELKPDRSLVTALDRAIEERLRERIAADWPAHGVLGEEFGALRPDADAVWVLDPIDGTAPFIAGVPVFGTLVALLWQGRPVLGVMDFPVTRERWVGVAGRATTHQGQPCRTRACESLADAMLSTSNPDFFAVDERPAFESLRAATRWRIYGGCCLAYGLLARGRTDLAIDAGFKIWDWAPFVPVIEGAGGVITDWQGQPLSLANPSTRILAAGDARRHAEALALIAKGQA